MLKCIYMVGMLLLLFGGGAPVLVAAEMPAASAGIEAADRLEQYRKAIKKARSRWLRRAPDPESFVKNQAYSRGIRVAVDELYRNPDSVGGGAVGVAGTPHRFHQQFPVFHEKATEEDLAKMLNDAAPPVRLMAVKCILTRVSEGQPMNTDFLPMLERLSKDKSELLVIRSGQMALSSEVGAEVVHFAENLEYLGGGVRPAERD